MENKNIKNTAAEENFSIFDTYTDEDWDAMYEAYCAEHGIEDIPDTLEWGLR